MNSKLSKYIFSPFHERCLQRSPYKKLRELEKTQYYSKEQLINLQLVKLKKILEDAYYNVPYYRNLLKKVQIVPEEIRGIDELRRLPLLTKNDIRSNFNELITKKKNYFKRKMNTGGSTGNPLIFYVDRPRIISDIALRIRSRRWWGIDIGDKELAFWGSPIEYTKQDNLKNIRDYFLNTKLLSAFNMTEQTMKKYANYIVKYRPKHIFGYPSSIALFAKYCHSLNIPLESLNVKTIFVTAEVLQPNQRTFIEKAFNCQIANGYGGRDGGFIAHECPYGNMHISEDIIVEIIKDNGKLAKSGEQGEIVITHLENYGMPLIRYRMGDLAISTDRVCKCGRNLPIIDSIEGRSTDLIITKNKKVIHALALIYPIREQIGIKQFKIFQKSTELFNIYLEIGNDFNENCIDYIRNKYYKILGDGVQLNFEIVDNIPIDTTKKFRSVESEVIHEYI